VNVFVSSCIVGEAGADALIVALRAGGHHVRHSPRHDGDFSDWYDRRLGETIGSCQVAIIVVDYVWNSSTWMGIEAEEIRRQLRETRLRGAFVYHAERTPCALGMRGYLDGLPEIDLGSLGASLRSIERAPTS
jgi:hypothetical protein